MASKSTTEKTLREIIDAYRLAISELSALTDQLSTNGSYPSRHLSKKPRTPRSPQSDPPILGISHLELPPISLQSAEIPGLDVVLDEPIPNSVQILAPQTSHDGADLHLNMGGPTSRPSAASIHTSHSLAGTISTNLEFQKKITDAGRRHSSTVFAGRREVDVQAATFYCDIFSSVMVLGNLIILGWNFQHYHSSGQSLEIVSTLDKIFCIILLLEICFRVYLEQVHFIIGVTNVWNVLDIVVFAAMLTEIIMLATDDGHERATHTTVLRAISFLRLFRIFRFVKVFRFLSYFRSGRLLLASLMHGYTAFAWFCIVSFTSVYAFSLVVASRSIYYCDDDREGSLLCEYFGSVWLSCSSLYQAMLGGIRWGVLYDALQVLEPFYSAALFLFVSFYYAVFLQVINGIFVVHVLRQDEAVKTEEVTAVNRKWDREFMDELSKNFKRLDINSNGVLCKDELAEMFEDKEMHSTLTSCNLDTHSAEALFDLIDGDKSGEINFYEFAMGCKKFRGQASAVAVEKLRRDIHELRSELRRGSKALAKDAVAVEPVGGAPSQKRVFSVTLSKNSSTRSISSNTLRSSVTDRPGTLIKQTEMRAMLIEELEDVVAVVRTQCAGWTDMESCEMLTPDKVNLYHFNYHLMSPLTAAPSITLKGLLKQSYPQDGILTQRHSSDSRIIGEACIIQDVHGTEVKVRILRGMFFPHIKVYLDYGDECGIVKQVENNGSSTSYKEVVASGSARPDWFCSHWWGEPILEFVSCCQAHSQKRRKNKYWVCAYANRQHELSSDINDDPEETSFRRAMKLAEGTLLLLDPSATPFKRIWCDFEIFTTISEGKTLDIVTLTDTPRLLTEKPLPGEHTFEKMKREYYFPLQLLHKGMKVELENGSATMDEDKINILNTMGKDINTGVVSDDLRRTNVDYANKSLRAYFALAAWPQAVKRGLANSLLEGVDTTLARIVRADAGRAALQLTLSGLKEMNDKEMQSIADCLPPRLLTLSLGLENCANISDVGVATVVENLQTLPLQELELDFVSCYNLTDASLVALASNLPSSLVSIKVHFDHCRHITQAGVKALAHGLPRSVKSLVATFKKTRCNETFTSVRQLRKF